MRHKLKIILTLAVTAALTFCAVSAPVSAEAEIGAYKAPCTVVRVGLYTSAGDGYASQKSFPSANLQNVTGFGSGYEMGYYDGERNFHSLGAFFDYTEITMMMDRTMTYDATTNSYSEGSGGPLVVGCVHLRLPETFDLYSAAKAVADEYEDAFVRYENGQFYVLVGQYVSSAAASEARRERGIDSTVDSGTSHTVTVVKSRTNRILFEYDCGTDSSLAVRPIAPEGEKAQTWFKNHKYYGDFSYLRNSGGNLTVVNYLDVEDYVKGVVPYEMSPSWPREALKAQAVAARTFVMANITKHRALGFDVCNTTCCQAYHGLEKPNGTKANENTDASVDETRGLVLTYKGTLCDTSYYSSNGGASENSENVWTAAMGYLKGVKDPYEKDIAGTASGYYWTRTFTPASLGQKLREKNYSSSDVVRVDMTFTAMGNVYSITFTDKNGKKNTISKGSTRTVLNLPSQRYTVNGLGPPDEAGTVYVNEDIPLEGGLSGALAVGSGGTYELPDGDVYAITGKGEVGKVDPAAAAVKGGVGVNSAGLFVFSGSGYGHNVGMSQWGAYSMAKYYGKTFTEILTFYYTDTQLAAATRTEPVYYPAPDDPATPDVPPDTPDDTTPDDTGTPEDTGTPDDTGTPEDTGTPDDTGTPEDTGAPGDAGVPDDTSGLGAAGEG